MLPLLQMRAAIALSCVVALVALSSVPTADALQSPCSYCQYCNFCSECSACPCDDKPNCHLCKYCTYCKFCKACDWFCDGNSFLSSIAGNLASAADQLKERLGFPVPDPTFSEVDESALQEDIAKFQQWKQAQPVELEVKRGDNGRVYRKVTQGGMPVPGFADATAAPAASGKGKGNGKKKDGKKKKAKQPQEQEQAAPSKEEL